jgi:hypothetical protein
MKRNHALQHTLFAVTAALLAFTHDWLRLRVPRPLEQRKVVE